MAIKFLKMPHVDHECLQAFRSGEKEKVLKLLPKSANPETAMNYGGNITKCNNYAPATKFTTGGWTFVHFAAYHGWGDVCKLLVEKYSCDPTAVDNEGRSPLHIACWRGREESVKYLVTLPSVLSRIDDKDTNGCTPLHLVCASGEFVNSVIEILLETNCVNITEVDNAEQTPLEILSNHPFGALVLYTVANKIDWSTQLPVKSFFSVFLVGNSGAGKSTLAAAMQELTKHSPTQHGRISNVEELTAGIVPKQCRGEFQLRENRQLLGRVYRSRVAENLSLTTNIAIYDLAGHSEYQSSHAAMLESLCLEAPAVFVVVIDLTKSGDQLKKELYKWAYFLEVQSSTISCRVIVLGSRKDQFLTKPEFLDSKCTFVEQCAKKAFGHQHFAGFVDVDARQLSSSNTHLFLQLLAININDLSISQVHEKMSFGCHFLYYFVKQEVKKNAISLLHLQKLISEDVLLCRLYDTIELALMLETIANKGLLLFLRNSRHLPSSCIVVDKIRLLQEVNGTLFAPSHFKEHHPVASNTGIVPLSRLHALFPHYDREVLMAFLTSLQFCRPLDPAVLANITTNLSPEAATSEQLLYFPALVRVEQKSRPSIPTGYGYCAYCTDPYKCLTPRFNDSLFLDLAYSSCSPIPTPPKLADPGHAAISKLNRSCTVWKNGIHWITDDGIQAMVQVTEENRCISLSLSTGEECFSKWLKLRSSLTELILSKKKTFCPSVDFTEYFISPSQLGLLSEESLSQLPVFEMKNVSRNVLLRSKFVHDVNQTERISPRSLLLADPYLVLPPTLVQQLFDPKKAKELVPSSSLKEVRHHFKDVPVPGNMTYQSLQKQLNNLSVFAGRNPMEIAGLKAEDLRYVPPFDKKEDAPPTSSMAPAEMAKNEQSKRGLTAKARVGEMDPAPRRTMWCLDSLPEGELDISHLRELDQCLHKLNDWMTLGLYLDVPHWTLERIRMENDRRVADCKREMLRDWLNTGTANKQALLLALRNMHGLN